MSSSNVCLLSFYRIWDRIAFHHIGSNYHGRNRKGIKRPVKLLPALTTLLLAGFFNPIYSQHQHRLDSLKELVRVKSGIDRYDPLTELAREYAGEEDYNKAIQVLKEADALAYHYGDTLKIIQSGRMIGQVSNRLSNHIVAMDKLLTVLPIAERTPNSGKDLGIILNGLALAYTFQAVYDKALYYNFRSLELREKIGDKDLICISLNNIGLVYYKLSNYDKAIIYYNKALEIKKELKDEYDLDRLFINLSLCHVAMKELSLAKRYLDEGFKVCKNNCSKQIMIEGKLAEGEVAFEENRFDDAKKNYLLSYQLSIDMGNTRFQLENLIVLAKLYNKLKNFRVAASYLNKAEQLVNGSEHNLSKIEICKHFSFLYNQTHDYKNAAKYQTKYIQLLNKFYGEELTQKLVVIQAEYEQRENKEKIKSQNKVLALKEEIISRQNILEIVASTTILLLGLLILTLYRNNRQKKTINAVLEQKIQERTRELEASHDLIQKAYLNQDNIVEKAAKGIKSSLSTMKGICSVGLTKFSRSKTQQYFIQFDDTTNQLDSMVDKLKSKREL